MVLSDIIKCFQWGWDTKLPLVEKYFLGASVEMFAEHREGSALRPVLTSHVTYVRCFDP